MASVIAAKDQTSFESTFLRMLQTETPQNLVLMAHTYSRRGELYEKMAALMYLSAAQQGSNVAQFYLGDAYRRGAGV
jgi:TPR repeat protein